MDEDDESDGPATGSTKKGKKAYIDISVSLCNEFMLSGMAKCTDMKLIYGGGFRGKLMFMAAVRAEVCNNVPGEYHEFMILMSDTLSIHAEEGRYVFGREISSLIGRFAIDKLIYSFSTPQFAG